MACRAWLPLIWETQYIIYPPCVSNKHMGSCVPVSFKSKRRCVLLRLHHPLDLPSKWACSLPRFSLQSPRKHKLSYVGIRAFTLLVGERKTCGRRQAPLFKGLRIRPFGVSTRFSLGGPRPFETIADPPALGAIDIFIEPEPGKGPGTE